MSRGSDPELLCNLNSDLEIDFNSEIPNWILDCFNTQEPEECIVEIPTMVQRMVHKKKCINKKRRKRYGTVIRYKKYHAKTIEFTPDDFYTVCAL